MELRAQARKERRAELQLAYDERMRAQHEQHAREHFQFGYVSTDGVAADIFTKSTHAPAKWAEARKQVNVFASMNELMSFAGFDGDASAATAVACLCAQSFGSDATECGVDSAVSFVGQSGRPMATEVPQLRTMPTRPSCSSSRSSRHAAAIPWVSILRLWSMRPHMR